MFLLDDLDELGEAVGPLLSKRMDLDCPSPQGLVGDGMDEAVDVVDAGHGWIVRFCRSSTIGSGGPGRPPQHRGSGGSGRFEVSALCFVPGDVPLADGLFRFRCESQRGHHGMGRLPGEPRQVPGVAQGAAGVVLPAGELRRDGNVVDLAGVAVAGPEYDVGVLEALQVLRRDAGGVVVGCEVVEVVVVQLFL